MKNYHVLVIAYPGQGHVIPLMDVARCLTSNGLKVTFVTTEAIHKRLMCAWSEIDDTNDLMQMVSIPDGMQPRDDRDDMAKLFQTMSQLMPSKLEKLIEDINKANNEKITCIVADYCMGWVSRVAKKMSIRQATFCSGSAALLALIMSVQKLLDDQVIDRDGVPLKYQMVQLSKSMPLMDPAKFTWECIGDSKASKIMFNHAILQGKEAAEAADRIICNSAMELEPGAFALFPKILPIGPLLASNKFRKQAGHFWSEDATCLEWLDQQPVSSVIYVAFGSYTIFDKNQFEELALGLELTNKPFLWVVRLGTSGSTEYVYSSGYVERVGTRGKMVSWAPQQDVLNHPSVGCFISHCGWNSTMEGVSNGVPFLCWPYFADQFLNASYICDIWKTGLGLNKDDTGIVTRLEIKRKVEELFSNDIFKQNELHVKEKTMDSVREGYSSDKNLSDFIDWVKKGNENAPASEN
ncbi:UDP-glucuronosyl/UDP-glucosyltransferase [Artemisia annua]|uniref:UDP-glucuronosyl/UDP-glucosyltransferase n=1 Tax=Artemisia annua TaxID=35608 RepID=A0A2U1NKE8_ARTAN|nr:UDP-glucuronosyl/UDP-glucosyltransferase [Artemisia annua]